MSDKCKLTEIRGLNLASMTLVERSQAINAMLKEANLRTLPSLGSNELGLSEIIDISEWREPIAAQWQDIVFLVRRKNGAEYNHQIRFNTNGATCCGVAFIPVINGQVALVKQFRIALGLESWELPRGFAECADDCLSSSVGMFPAALARELSEEVVREFSLLGVHSLGEFAENTGTHNSWVQAYIVELAINPARLESSLGGSQGLKVKLINRQDLRTPSALGIRDAHSLALIALLNERDESIESKV